MLQTKVVKKIKTRILRYGTFFYRKSNRLWDMWENIVQTERPQMTIWSMHIVRCIL